MALGYLGSNVGSGGEKLELKGQEYFDDLAMRSLFQDFVRDDDKIVSCKMHDIVHDFAHFLRNNEREEIPVVKDEKSCRICDNPFLFSRVKGYRSLFWDEETPPNNCECLATLRVLRFKKGLNCIPEGMGSMIHLQWLDISGTTLSKEDLESIFKLYFLQTLLLQDCSITEIPNEIGNLVQMRYLNLSENEELKELPESIRNLLRLQTLGIASCRDLRRLPDGIHRLKNLKHIFLEGTTVSCCFPQGVGELSGLQTLSEFCGGSDWNKLGLLNKLNNLTESLLLKIKVSGNSDLVEDAVEAKLSNKICLQMLEIEFEDESRIEEEPSSSSSLLWVDLIEALEPHHYLKDLSISGYMGWRLPDWMSSPFNHVTYICLVDCFRISSLPPMGKLPSLESLILGSMRELKVLGAEWLGIRGRSSEAHIPSSSSSSTNTAFLAFPKLKHLKFYNCDKWEEWEDITTEEEAIQLMPSLIQLEIYFCNTLKKLPHRLLRKANSLEGLVISSSSELQKIYRDKLLLRDNSSAWWEIKSSSKIQKIFQDEDGNQLNK